jgi:hypothetical protein
MDIWTSCESVEQNPEKVNDAWVFRGTRVPVKALFENLEDGATIDEFFEWFPGVTRARRYSYHDRDAMKILFDQGTPVPLRRHLHPHSVDTLAELGWSTLTSA